MSTVVTVSTYTHAVTYVSEKILSSIEDVIRQSGLSPSHLVSEWKVLSNGISTWLRTQHLNRVTLEVYNPRTDALVGRWDFEIGYGYTGDGSFWLDPELVRWGIRKQGLWPSDCSYRITCNNKDGRPDVDGWSPTTMRSTDGFVFQGIGSVTGAQGLTASTGYWRKT